MKLVYDGTQLKLEGRTDIGALQTFHDTYDIKVSRQGPDKFRESTVFRPCWQANAAAALGRVKTWFNNLKIEEGDLISIHGEKYRDSVRFPNSSKTIIQTDLDSRINHNDYELGYQSVNRNHIAFRVNCEGLKPVWIRETL